MPQHWYSGIRSSARTADSDAIVWEQKRSKARAVCDAHPFTYMSGEVRTQKTKNKTKQNNSAAAISGQQNQVSARAASPSSHACKLMSHGVGLPPHSHSVTTSDTCKEFELRVREAEAVKQHQMSHASDESCSKYAGIRSKPSWVFGGVPSA